MNAYEEDYYLIFRDYDEENYNNAVIPTQTTANRNWYFEKLSSGGAPVSFISKNKDLDFIQSDFEILFNSPNFIVTRKLKELIDSGLYGCQFYPAVVEGENGKLKDDLWLLNTFDKLDCLDVKKSSVYLPEDGVADIDGLKISPDVDVYRFDSDILSSIPEDDRLIFQVANTTTSEIFIHKKVVNMFNKCNVKGVNFFKVSEYESGDEF